jgi:hypothetical protein
MRAFLCVALLIPAAAGTRKAAVVVYGASAGGVIAAVAAAREGKSVLLLEPGRHVGGMVSGGLGATDHGNRGCIGGYSREFFNRVRDHYAKQYGADSEQVKDCSDGFKFEPHVATLVFQDMLREAKIEPLFDQRLAGAKKEGGRVTSITTAKGDGFEAAVWIDASYEGDLLARAGVACVWGREGRGEHNEPLAGVQAHSAAHQWAARVPGRDDSGRLLPCIQSNPLEPAGSGDKKLQAYNFRLCMTDRKENMVPWPKPANYDPKRYEILVRYLLMKPGLKVGALMNPVRMPNGKTDTNNNGAFSTDHIGANWDYIEADDATREKIRQDHIDYIQGFYHFLATDPRVPTALHDEINGWGLAKDEFSDTDHWPHQLYVREARRMKGEYFMTQKDIMDDRSKADSIGLGSYNTDSHHCQRVILADGTVLNEGDFQVRVSPYAIPYRSLVPKAAECGNVLSVVCMSASHVAYGTIRMEPVYMIIGQACGVAAAMAIDAKSAVQEIDVARLTEKLAAQKAVLSPEHLGAGPRPRLEGVVVDDADAIKTGDWAFSTSTPGFIGNGYLHDNNQDKGRKSVKFSARLPAEGVYEVFFYYTPNPNRATNVPVLIGDKRVLVNERQPLKDGRPLSLGVFTLSATPAVEVLTEGTDGFVVVDAVQFVPRK